MKKLINLIAFVMLVSTNVLTPFSYAQVETPELIPENEVGNVEEIGETPEKDNEITGEIPNSLGEVEGEGSLPLVREVVNESEPEGLKEEVEDSLDDVESPTTDENKDEDTEKGESDEVAQQEEENTKIEKQEEILEDNNEITEQENVEAEIQELQKIQEISTMDTATNSKNIVLQATATEAGQTLKINKYFANAYTVDWGDGSPVEIVSSDKSHTYSVASGYTITLSTTADRWTFQSKQKPLVPKEGTTMTGVKITYMPSLADGFGTNSTAPGAYFFYYFNKNGVITSLPDGSFDTSNIITVGAHFFSSFNNGGNLTSLPSGSFDTSKIISAGASFFNSFNYGGKLTSLPNGSFRFATGLKNIRSYSFFHFNDNGELTNLPDGSFDTSNITTVGSYFCANFNDGGKLTGLPSGSFNISEITTAGEFFFYEFNYGGQLTSLPTGSFNFSGITQASYSFFRGFNTNGQLTSLPAGSFDTSKITIASGNFFAGFNNGGKLTSLPAGSFDTSHITLTDYSFFENFNANGALTSLPAGSFDTSNITTVGNYFFYRFNENGSLTSLPSGSFDTSHITSVGNSFFYYFNGYGSLESLPNGSFQLSTGLTTVGDSFFRSFNYSGALESLPDGSFDTSNITSAGDMFFYYFNENGSITYLPDSFTMNSVRSSSSGYDSSFNSTGHTINRKVSDLVRGLDVPETDMDTFSDNQPGRCGVNENWLVSKADACHIIYDANEGEGTTTGGYESDATIIEVGTDITLPTRVGYSLSGWQDASGNKVEEIVFPEMDGQTLYANWTPNEYTITFEDSSEENEKIEISGLYLSDTSSVKYPKWTREGYKIVWDKEIPATMPAENMIIKASWEKNGYSGGGGRGGSSKKTDEDTHGSAEDSQKNTQDDKNTENVIQSETKGSEESSNTPVDSSADKSASEGQEILSPSDSSFTKEQKDAYTFAKENGITTKDTIQSAQMNGKLTRIAMAKMLSQYAINVLRQTPDTSKTVKFKDVTDKRNADYDNGVTLAYQLGIMGQNMKDNKFRPDDEVTRAEFVTALSRLLYSTSDGEYKNTSKYYVNHMEKLVSEGIITNDDPKMKERRGYVMIMLMRSAK